MNNLKRVLSTVLAGTMLAGMMVVGASAASFPDADKIEHTEAVNTLTALNVISGKEDGNYDPQGSLTRAEMAKLAVFILHGGKDPVLGTKANPSYSDIKGNWAESYIEYCSATGVIAGMGDGTFGPNATLTGSQAAKMLMVAMGYNAEVFGFTGTTDWEMNVNVEANKIGLYEGLETMDPSLTITRDNAAQLVYNAIFAGTMGKTYTHDIATGNVTNTYTLDTTKTLFATKFNGAKEYGYITGVSYDSVKEEYNYTLTNAASFGAAKINNSSDTIVGNGLNITSITSKVDYSALYGQKVAVVYKDAATDVLYGIYGQGTVIAEGIVDQLATVSSSDSKVKLAGTTYTLGADRDEVPVYAFNASSVYTNDDIDAVIGANVSTAWTDAAAKVVLIDNTGDDKADTMIIYPVNIQKVTYVGKASVSAGVSYSYSASEGLYSYTTGGVTTKYAFPEVVKGDYVAIDTTRVDDVPFSVELLETKNGKVEGIDSTNRKVKLDGEWVNYIGSVSFTLGNTVKVQLCNGVIVDSSVQTTASKDLLFLVTAEPGNSLNKTQAKVVFADGSTEIVEVNKLNGNSLNGADITPDHTLYTYVKNSDGSYNFTKVDSDNKAGYNAYATVQTNGTDSESTPITTGLYTAANGSSSATFNGQMIADDAIIFLQTGTSTVKVIDGKTLKTYSTTNGYELYTDGGSNKITSQILLDTTNGIYGVKVATMKNTSAIGTTSNYGYVVSDPYTTSENNKTVYNYTLWTADGSIEVKDTKSVKNGDLVKYVVNTDGTITSSAHGMTATAITGYNADEKIITMSKADGTALGKVNATIANNATILFIDTTNGVGVEGGELALAQQLEDGSYIMNAYGVYEGDKITAIVFDVNNDLDDSGHTTDENSGNTLGNGTAGALVTLNVNGSNINNKLVAGTNLTFTCEGEYYAVNVKIKADDDLKSKELTATSTSTSGDHVTSATGKVTVSSSTKANDAYTMYVLISGKGATPLTAGVTITVSTT